MAFVTRSSVLAVIKEDTSGTLKQPTAGTDFTVLNDGYSIEGALETVSSAELINDIGASKSFATKEAPTGSIPKYFKHSGVEGQAPDYSVMIESAIGSVIVNSTEYSTIAGSIAGDSTTRAYLQLNTGIAANFEVGQALLIKLPSSAWVIRNIHQVDTINDRLYLNFNMDSAAGTGVDLGKAIFYQVQATDHPSYSMHRYQSSTSSSGFKDAIAGCKTTNMGISFPVNDLASIDFTVEGISYYFDPIEITATTDTIDFTDDGGAKVATLDAKVYKHPEELAAAVAQRMSAVSVNTILCSYSGSKFTISSDGAVFELDFASVPSGDSAAAKLGFDATDLTGATTYTAQNAQTWGPEFTPSFDDQTPTVVKSNELMIGTFDKNICRSGSNVSLTIGTPKSDINDFCAPSGVSSSVINSRTAELTATLIFKKDEVDTFYSVLQNSEVSVAFNHGPKSGGNWEAGKCVNVYMQSATITQSTIADEDGFVIVSLSASGYVTTDTKDIALNFL